jgi:type II secretory ATPase GspE/PulE/Tfp pilus assembly ATPase PilB-like protein
VTDLTKLGFAADSREVFGEMLQRSYGMILVTGPTGSGKTTTLYAALAAARDETKNVITVEDPVEYELEGVTQTNVQADIDLTFATQLRAILRQDPDVILVGEIRDTETAEVSIRAALTGHLVLSTLHTNSAVGAVTRLQDMGVAPFLIASSLSGVLAQRLVRLICRGCRQPLDPNSAEYKDAVMRLRLPEGTQLWHGAGCDACNGTGHRGRMAIIELLPVDSDLRRAIMQKSDSDTLRQIAVKAGMKTLWEDGIDKMLRGLTTADEISRVLLGAQEDE